MNTRQRLTQLAHEAGIPELLLAVAEVCQLQADNQPQAEADWCHVAHLLKTLAAGGTGGVKKATEES